ncbi:MAG: hypothetical protein IKH26_02790 [Bacteroidaceae bacterium]|nr:hypothetical protein [Bacteroidaceae bacterium]
MRKLVCALMAMIVLASCGDKNAKNSATNGESIDSLKGDAETAVQKATEFADLPLLVISDYETPDWYAPIGYQSAEDPDADYANFTEEQWKELAERQEKEKSAFFEMLKKHMEEYTVLRTPDGDKKVSFVSANFDKGQESTIAMGWQGAERDEHMKYLRYRNESGVNENGWDMAILVTEEYAQTHKPLKVENVGVQYEDGVGEVTVPLPMVQIQELEKATGKKVKKSRLNTKIEEDMYQFYTVMFENEGDKAYAMQVFISRKGLHLGKMETTDVEGGEAMWAVDMEGDYPYQGLIAADDDGKTVTFWFTESAPEHIDMGCYRIEDDKVVQRIYSSNYVWVN